MTDQPVTPDREALIDLTSEIDRHLPTSDPGCSCGWLGVDWQLHLRNALLPLLADALDRARQQGEREGRDEAAQAIRDDGDRAEHFGGLRTSIAVYRHCEMLATGEEQPQPRLARGGPNRKDEE